MIPGAVSRITEGTLASAATIEVNNDMVLVTGTTAINTILPALGTAQGQLLILVPVTAGGVTLGTSGNILQGLVAIQNRAVYLVWVKSLQKWVINSGV